jgi:hypothetical protein
MSDQAYEAAKRRAAELVSMFAAHQAVTEAELAARAIHPVSVVAMRRPSRTRP